MSFSPTVSVFLLMVSSPVCISVDITARGTEGEHVTIKCPYPGGYENSYKYFYKGPYRDNNLLLQSDGGESSVDKDRFSLQDDHQTRSFTVTIRNLRMTDAGEYSCGTGWMGEYKRIQLNVIKAPQKTTPVQILTSTLHPDQTMSTFSNTPLHLSTSDTKPGSSTITDHHISSPGSFLIIITAEVVVLLLIGLPLIIVTLQKKKKNKGLLSSSIEEFNPVIYEQIKYAGCPPENRDTESTVVYSCVS